MCVCERLRLYCVSQKKKITEFRSFQISQAAIRNNSMKKEYEDAFLACTILEWMSRERDPIVFVIYANISQQKDRQTKDDQHLLPLLSYKAHSLLPSVD